MSLLASLFGYLVSAALLPVMMLLFLVQRLLGNQRLFDPLIKATCRAWPLAFGVRVRTSGRHRLDRTRAYIFMANHVNIFDPLVLYGHIPNFVRALELEDHFSWPVWGTIVRSAGNIPISHRHIGSALKSLRLAAEVVTGGTSLLVLPEGHRTRTGNLGRFMRGAFRLAKAVDADIVPVAMNGLYERKSIHSPRVRPGPVRVIFGKPIAHDDISSLSERELLDTVKDAVEELIARG